MDGSGRVRHRLRVAFVYALLVCACAVIIVPFIWMASTSVKASSRDVWARGLLSLIPRSFTLDWYVGLFHKLPIGQLIFNSVVASLGSTVLNVIICALAADALARRRIVGAKAILFFFVAMMIVPQEVIAIPLYLIMASMGLLNTHEGLILALAAEGMSIVILYRFFAEVPTEIIDAAKVDGATDLQLICRIMLPLAMPALMTVVLIQFIQSWNAFIIPLVVAQEMSMYTLQVGMAFLNTDLYVQFESLMAMGALITIPTIVIFALTQRSVIRGITAGALKG
jgi:multiple sugar transport system permease protein